MSQKHLFQDLRDGVLFRVMTFSHLGGSLCERSEDGGATWEGRIGGEDGLSSLLEEKCREPGALEVYQTLCDSASGREAMITEDILIVAEMIIQLMTGKKVAFTLLSGPENYEVSGVRIYRFCIRNEAEGSPLI